MGKICWNYAARYHTHQHNSRNLRLYPFDHFKRLAKTQISTIFTSMNHLCFDGRFLPADRPVLLVDNKGYRYGDGIFETIKVHKGMILLDDLHFERLFTGFKTLGFAVPELLDAEKLRKQILLLCAKNQCADLARVRLTAFRGHGGINEDSGLCHYSIEAWTAPPSVNEWNENGLVTGLYTDAKKSCDGLSHLKSANYLPYVMAARFAKEKKWNDAMVMNSHDRIAETSIMNLYIVKDGEIHTPPLSEGCVSGIMRKYLLSKLPIQERPLTERDLLVADELFLSNAMTGIRWIKEFGEREYTQARSREIYASLIRPMFD